MTNIHTTQIPDWYDSVGLGWRTILENLHQQLTQLTPNYAVAQIKEKFGTLRVYLEIYGESGDDVSRAIRDAEWESSRTCEYCGKPGKQARTSGWIKTICGECDGPIKPW